MTFYDGLEPRNLFAAMSFAGSAGDDRVTVQVVSAATLRVTVRAKLYVVDPRVTNQLNIDLGAGNDRLDWLTPAPAGLRVSVRGGAGNDTLYGNNGNDTLIGDTGNDYLSDGAGDDLLYGGDGSDHLLTGAGRDTAYGDAGKDTMATLGANAGFIDQLVGGPDHDRMTVAYGRATLRGEGGNDTLTGGASASTLQGGDGDDSLVGGTGHEYMTGGFGRDILRGNAGNDTLWGGEDNDILSGGTGYDEFHAGSGNDQIRAVDEVLRESVDGGSGRDVVYVDLGTDGKPADRVYNVESWVR